MASLYGGAAPPSDLPALLTDMILGACPKRSRQLGNCRKYDHLAITRRLSPTHRNITPPRAETVERSVSYAKPRVWHRTGVPQLQKEGYAELSARAMVSFWLPSTLAALGSTQEE